MKSISIKAASRSATQAAFGVQRMAVIAIACWIAGAYSASASLLVSEDFNYPSLPAELNGQNGGTGFSGAWTANTGVTEVRSPSLTFTRGDGYTYAPVGGSLELLGNVDDAAHRTLASAINGDAFYVSLLLNVSGSLQDNDFGAGWFNSVTGIGLGLKANQGNGSGSYDVFARAKYDAGAPDAGAYYQNLTIGQTYLIVARFSKTTPGVANPFNEADLWVNPIYASSGSANASINQSAPGLSTSVSTLGFRSANLDPGDAVYYDALRIGTTWADVVPVPEPTTVVAGALLLLPFGASTLRMLRKSRKA